MAQGAEPVRATPPPHGAIAAPLTALDVAGVRWCLLRGADELHRLNGDVDLLVDRRALRTLPATLAAAGGFAPLPAWGRGAHRFFIAYVADEDAWLKLDVVSELHFGRHQELPTRTADAVLARRVRPDRLWLPAPVDRFWALLLHAVLDRGHVRPLSGRELVGLAPCARGEPSPLAEVVAVACPEGWDPPRMLEAAAAGRFEELVGMAPALRAGWPGTWRGAIASRMALRAAARRAGRRLHRQHSRLMTSNKRPRSAG
jgi:hypothetical protein